MLYSTVYKYDKQQRKEKPPNTQQQSLLHNSTEILGRGTTTAYMPTSTVTLADGSILSQSIINFASSHIFSAKSTASRQK